MFVVAERTKKIGDTYAQKLDPQLMAVAAQSLIGTYDLTPPLRAMSGEDFGAVGNRLSVHHHDQLIALHVEANGFCNIWCAILLVC